VDARVHSGVALVVEVNVDTGNDTLRETHSGWIYSPEVYKGSVPWTGRGRPRGLTRRRAVRAHRRYSHRAESPRRGRTR
jgi:hypothetical protein